MDSEIKSSVCYNDDLPCGGSVLMSSLGGFEDFCAFFRKDINL